MKGLKSVLGLATAGALIYVVYILVKRSRVAPIVPSGTGDGTVVTEGDTTTSSQVGCDSGCCNNACATIDKENPGANYGCCGSVVQAFQIELNNMAGAGVNLVPDGAYGPATQAAHQQILAANNGVWPEFVGPTMPSDL
jgi:hypothetical protein